jgi:hypothetical protein
LGRHGFLVGDSGLLGRLDRGIFGADGFAGAAPGLGA